MRAFHVKFSDAPLAGFLRRLNVQVFEVPRHSRHRDRLAAAALRRELLAAARATGGCFAVSN